MSSANFDYHVYLDCLYNEDNKLFSKFMYALFEEDLKDSISKYPTIKSRKYMFDVIYKKFINAEYANEI